jgi:hypothetical protein
MSTAHSNTICDMGKTFCVLLSLVGGSQHFTYTFKNSLKTEAAGSFETLVSTYQTTQCHNLEDHKLNLNCHGNLISQ